MYGKREAKSKSSRNTLSDIMYIPVSLTFLGLIQTPEDVIQGLN